MELIITEKESDPTICLNMIVKNESHIIKDTLEKLCSKIKFSYWVISDTGSTDRTCEIVKNFFEEIGFVEVFNRFSNGPWETDLILVNKNIL